MLFYDLLELMHECINILELTIYGCKSNISNLVDLLELLHYLFADNVARDLP